MTATVHPLPMPTRALYLARQVGRCPDRYETADLVAACSVLDDCGDWYDMQSATMMRHIMRERADTTPTPEPEDDTPGDMSGWAWVFWGSAALWLAVTLGVIGWLS